MSKVNLPQAIEHVDVSALVPYARNSRTHSDEQVAQLVASMREFGFTNPVLIDEAGGIIAGHGRVMAAKSLGLESVPCIRLAHLSASQKRAYVIADNKLALNAGWDEAVLRSEMAALKLDSFDLSLLGFSGEELDVLNEPLADEEDARDPDASPALSQQAHSCDGDVWILGPHRVACGDTTRAETWERLMGSELADCIWTDPPYNVAYEGKAGKIKNDDMSAADFLQFLRQSFAAMFGVLKPGGAIYVAHADTEGLNFRRAFSDAGFKLSGCLIWRKDSLVLGRSDYQWQHEPILYGWKPGSAHRWYGGRKQTTIQDMGEDSPFRQQEDGTWAIKVGDQVLVVDGKAQLVGEIPSSLIRCQKPARSAQHPTMKPVALIEKQLRFSARPGDVVADAFGGSGSTLMAADRLGMVARLTELDPRFVDVIVKRWQNYSGRAAVHAMTGREFPEPPEVGQEA
jgi:DNA modification methylase